ncbi:MAG: shikimate dehydrogenase family protein [Myxococcota bacterium]
MATRDPANGAATRDLRLGLLGAGIGHSRSPHLHRAALQTLGRKGTYELLEAESEAQAQAVVERLRAGELDGLNVTTPWKPWAAAQCAFGLDAVGRVLPGPPDRPVNTLAMRDGQLCGGSTDGPGLLDALAAADVDLRGARVLLLGAGGAGTAVAPELLAAGAAGLWVANRAQERAQALVVHLSRFGQSVEVQALPWGHRAPDLTIDWVIHATRWGHGEGQPYDRADVVAWDWLPWPAWRDRGTVVADLVYGASPTRFEALALAHGIPACRQLLDDEAQVAPRGVLLGSGEAMLAAQAARVWRLWTGDHVDWRELKTALRTRDGR